MKKEKTAKVYGRTRKYKILHILGIIACLVMVILLVFWPLCNGRKKSRWINYAICTMTRRQLAPIFH